MQHLSPHQQLILTTGVFLSVLFCAHAGTLYNLGQLGAVDRAQVTTLTNEARTAVGEHTLSRNTLLDHSAQLKAEDMARYGYFAHRSPAGVTPWYWFKQSGYRYSRAGENLAVRFNDSKDVIDAWLNSPTHRANILNTNFTEIGIGVATGTFEGKEAVFTVQHFGQPARASVAFTVQNLAALGEARPVIDTTDTAAANELAMISFVENAATQQHAWNWNPLTIALTIAFILVVISILRLLLGTISLIVRIGLIMLLLAASIVLFMSI